MQLTRIDEKLEILESKVEKLELLELKVEKLELLEVKVQKFELLKLKVEKLESELANLKSNVETRSASLSGRLPKISQVTIKPNDL